MKVIIAGGRDFNDYELLKAELNLILCIRVMREDLEILSGGAKGADALGEQYAKEYNVPVKRFPADWNKYGKSAGPIRNTEMAKYAEGCIVFWDGKSKGTKNMIETARNHRLILHVIKY